MGNLPNDVTDSEHVEGWITTFMTVKKLLKKGPLFY